ncbi:hypothetical protein [Bacillus sp. 165]
MEELITKTYKEIELGRGIAKRTLMRRKV